MKQLFKLLVGCMLMMAWPLMMTSCEGTLDDIFGEWSRPGSQPTKEEVLENLSSALEEGALVTITYTIDGVEYTSTFKRVGDEYILQSIAPAAARTRAEDNKDLPTFDTPFVYDIMDFATHEDLVCIKVDKGNQTKLEATMKVKSCELVTHIATEGSGVKDFCVNNKKAAVINHETERLTIQVNTSGEAGGNVVNVQIPYTPGQTYDKMVAEKQANGGQYMQIDRNNQVCMTYNGQSGHLVIGDGGQLKNDDLVGAVKGNLRIDQFPPVIYVERSWDAINHKVVMNELVTNFNLVTDAQTNVTWEGGIYVVNQNVTINGNVKIENDVELILCDGCTLTVNGKINGENHSFTIYGQTAGSGKLIQKKYVFGLCYFTDLVIHGGNIEMENNRNQKFSLKMYGGKFTARSSITYPIIDLMRPYNNITIYGGELEALSDNSDAIIVGDDNNPSTLTVYGGKVTASAPNGQAIIGKFARGEGTEIEFFGSNNGEDWDIITKNGTTTAPYFMAMIPM